jgi:hypothetical protein
VQLDVAADLALAALLLLTAGWCALVHQRLRRLRTERGEMEAFIATLAAATERAEVATGGLRDAVAEAGRGLREQEEAARQRASDLARQVDSGNRVLRRLETAVLQGARSLAEQGISRERPAEPAPAQAAGAGETRERRVPRQSRGPAARGCAPAGIRSERRRLVDGRADEGSRVTPMTPDAAQGEGRPRDRRLVGLSGLLPLVAAACIARLALVAVDLPSA